MTPPDYYRILHVQPDAPAAIIHASYRTLAERAVSSSRAQEEMALLDRAYAVLGDARRRAAYDLERLANAADDARPAGEHADAGMRRCLFCATAHEIQRALERDDLCVRCGSPLYPAERHRLEYSGQRMLGRVPKQRAIEIRVTWPQDTPIKGEMRNLSLNGMSFVSPVRFEPNQLVRIDCTELRALGRVAHIEADAHFAEGFVAGLEFLTLRFRQVRGSFVSDQA